MGSALVVGSRSAVSFGAPVRRRFTHPAITALLVLSAIVAGALVSGCAVKLAPDFDRTIVEGLTRANEEAMTLFATVSQGVDKRTFPQRQKTYDGLIGKFDALRLQTSVRAAPQSPIPSFLLSSDKQTQVSAALTPPTPEILAAIIRTFKAMRDADRKVGIAPFLLTGFRQEFELSMQQALAYEKALER